jgi:hypothetical protein
VHVEIERDCPKIVYIRKGDLRHRILFRKRSFRIAGMIETFVSGSLLVLEYCRKIDARAASKILFASAVSNCLRLDNNRFALSL